MQRIAVVGSGIAGLGAAWALSRHHHVSVYEAAAQPGGHANTMDVPGPGGATAVDTGFIVYNETNYPHLTRLFRELDVVTEPSSMSFAASLDGGRTEYAGSPRGLFAQPANAVRPRHWRMLRDTLRFFREAPELLDGQAGDAQESLGIYLDRGGYSPAFVEDHLLPMAAAIWSCPTVQIRDFPAHSFVRFLHNHGLLLLRDRPQWRTVSGGSREYVRKVTAAFADSLRLATPVESLRRTPESVWLTPAGGAPERFDSVVLATHADQARTILGDDADRAEDAVLGAFRYASNDAILHSDPLLMPRRRRVWSSWNYIAEGRAPAQRRVSVTYWMNRLQNLPGRDLFVSLNPLQAPDPAQVHARFSYDHPIFDAGAIAAQRRLPEIQGVRRTWFCGSYCGYGFHEDGLEAGLAVAAALGAPVPWAKEVTPASPAAQIAPVAPPPVAPRLAAAE